MIVVRIVLLAGVALIVALAVTGVVAVAVSSSSMSSNGPGSNVLIEEFIQGV